MEERSTAMSSGSQSGEDQPDAAETPTTEELEEPSTEKAPDEEPKAETPASPEPSHEAVGIGVIGRPLVEPEPASEPD